MKAAQLSYLEKHGLAFGWLATLAVACHFAACQRAEAVLVAHWDLEEGSGTTTTAAVGSPAADGLFLSAAGWDTAFLPPVVGGTSAAAVLTGSPDAIVTESTGVTGSTARTIAAWVRADPSQPGFGTIVSWGNNATGLRSTFRTNTGAGDGVVGALRYEIQGDFVIGNAVVTDGQWHHVAMVLPDDDPDGDTFVDLDDISFYVNGVLDADINIGFSGGGAADEPVNTTISNANDNVTVGNSASLGINGRGFNGSLDDLRIYDEALDASAIAGLAPTPAGSFGITIDRQTGAMSLANSTANDISFIAYSIDSAAGSLDPSGWTSIADGNPDWGEFTDPAAFGDLSEGDQPGGSGVTITSSDPAIDLGTPWVQSPIEDITMEILTDDDQTISVPVAFTGNEIPIGDMDFDGDVDADDWPTYRSGLFADLSDLTLAQQYQMGDLDGDGFNNEVDFDLFKQAFDANMGPGAFAAMISGVPEPGSVALLALGGIVLLVAGRRKNMLRVSSAVQRCLAVAAVSTIIAVGPASATVVWTGGGIDPNDLFGDDNYDFSASTVTAIDESTNGAPFPVLDDVTIAGATIVSPYALGFGQYAMGDGFTLTLDGSSVTSTGTGGIAGENDPDDEPSFFDLTNGSSMNMQFMSVGATVNVDGTSSLQFRGGGDPINSQTEPVRINLEPGAQLTLPTVAEFTEQGDDIFVGGVNFTTDPSILSFSGTTGTAIGSAPPLTLEINTDTGRIRLINETGSPIDMDFYKLTSATDSLDVAGWVSIEDSPTAAFPSGNGNGDGWEEGGSSNNGELGEAYLQGFSTLPDGEALNLGSAFQQGSGSEDILLTYRDTGLGSFIRDIEATYVTGGGVGGDYNGDGVVDAADYTVWRDNEGASITLPNEDPDATTPGVVDDEDYDYWRSQFGQVAGSGALQGDVAAVPEPGALALLGLAVGATLAFGRRRAAAALLALLVAPACLAASVDDRIYGFGDDSFENAVAGERLGDASGFANHTLDSAGMPDNNTFVDLTVNGDPRYVNVDALGRPLADTNELGAEFDGVGDFVRNFRLGFPETSFSSTLGLGPGPFNYEGITDRGFQLWARPASAGNGTAQSLVSDTEQHGVRINAAGNWEVLYNGALTDTGVAVDFNSWSHLMLVRPFGGAGGARFYVDGEVVTTVAGGYTTADDTDLVVGANSGDMAGTADFYNGIIDDLDMFVLGVTDSAVTGPFTDYGTFNSAEDNDFIADALAGMTPGDLTGDNQVTDDDVTAFIANWDTVYTVGDIQVGDLVSRDLGDFDLDGDVDLRDWNVLQAEHINGGSLNLGELLAGRGVPEPTSVAIGGLGLAALMALRFARRHRRA